MVDPWDDKANVPHLPYHQYKVLLCCFICANYFLNFSGPRYVFVLGEGHGKCLEVNVPAKDNLHFG